MSNDTVYIDRFLEMMAAEGGASQNTLSAYRSDLEQASSFAKGKLADSDRGALQDVASAWSDLEKQ